MRRASFLTSVASWLLVVQVVLWIGDLAQGVPERPDEISFTLTHPLHRAEQILQVGDVAKILSDHARPRLDEAAAFRTARVLLDLCNQYRLSPSFVLGLIFVESSFNARAVSSQGARGWMQLLPSTARVVAQKEGVRWRGAESLFEPEENMRLGMAYLAQLRGQFKERHKFFFVAAYLVGPARVSELIEKKSFRPVQTLKYYQRIQDRMLMFQSFRNPVRV